MVEPALPEPGHLACPVDQGGKRAELRAIMGLSSFMALAWRRAPEQASLNLPYPAGYVSFVVDRKWPWRRGDALHIAAIRRCLRHATCKRGLILARRNCLVENFRCRPFYSAARKRWMNGGSPPSRNERSYSAGSFAWRI